MNITPGDMFKYSPDSKQYKFVYDLVINVEDDHLYVMQCYAYVKDDIVRYAFWKRAKLENERMYSSKDKWEKLC